VIKSRRTRWAGHVACMGREETYRGFWWGNMGEIQRLEDPGVDGGNVKMDLREEGREGMDWIDLGKFLTS